MTVMRVQGEVSRDGKLRIDIPCGLPPGPVEVVLRVQPRTTPVEPGKRKWDDLYGLGKEVWHGVDPDNYVQDLRRDPESSS
ncbi:MAG: hypothetical protein HY721_18860 [Planctomycetes bacterium]|nr:hypothetical protein [Planctomycetota bacterium]